MAQEPIDTEEIVADETAEETQAVQEPETVDEPETVTTEDEPAESSFDERTQKQRLYEDEDGTQHNQ